MTAKLKSFKFFSGPALGILALVSLLFVVPIHKAEAFNPNCVPVMDDYLYYDEPGNPNDRNGVPITWTQADEDAFNASHPVPNPQGIIWVSGMSIGEKIREDSQYAFDHNLVPTFDSSYGYPGIVFGPIIQSSKIITGPPNQFFVDWGSTYDSTATFSIKYYLKFTCSDHPGVIVRVPDGRTGHITSNNVSDTIGPIWLSSVNFRGFRQESPYSIIVSYVDGSYVAEGQGEIIFGAMSCIELDRAADWKGTMLQDRVIPGTNTLPNPDWIYSPYQLYGSVCGGAGPVTGGGGSATIPTSSVNSPVHTSAPLNPIESAYVNPGTGGSCSNGATNYPDCTTSGNPPACLNGATNPPTCTTGGSGGGGTTPPPPPGSDDITLVPLSVSCSAYNSSNVVITSATTGFPVYWKASSQGGDGTFAYSWSGSDLSSGLASGSTYLINYPSIGQKNMTVTVSSAGVSTSASCGNVSVGLATPSVAPSALACEMVGTNTVGKINLSWGASAGAASYKLYRGTASNFTVASGATLVGTFNTTYPANAPFVDLGLTPETVTYYYRLVAYSGSNGSGNASAESLISSGFKANRFCAPGVPTSRVATPLACVINGGTSNGRIQLTWVAPSNVGSGDGFGPVENYSIVENGSNTINSAGSPLNRLGRSGNVNYAYTIQAIGKSNVNSAIVSFSPSPVVIPFCNPDLIPLVLSDGTSHPVIYSSVKNPNGTYKNKSNIVFTVNPKNISSTFTSPDFNIKLQKAIHGGSFADTGNYATISGGLAYNAFGSTTVSYTWTTGDSNSAGYDFRYCADMPPDNPGSINEIQVSDASDRIAGVGEYNNCSDYIYSGAATEEQPPATVGLQAYRVGTSSYVPILPFSGTYTLAVSYGSTVELKWTSEYAASCNKNPSPVVGWTNQIGTSGTQIIGPLSNTTQTYTITCRGLDGADVTSNVIVVTVNPPSLSCTGSLNSLTGTWTATPSPLTVPTGVTYSYVWSGSEIPANSTGVMSGTNNANSLTVNYTTASAKTASVVMTPSGTGRTAITATCTPNLNPLPDLTPLGAAGTNDTGLPNKPVINTGTTNPSDSKYRAGTAITVNVEPKNIGAGFTSPIFSIKLQRKLSTETSYTGGVFAGTVDVAANTVIAKGDTVPKVITTTLPSAVNATYNFRYCIDTDLAVPESNDGNNCSGDLIVPASIGTCTDLNNCPTLTVTKIGTGTGTVTSSETTPKISCGSGAFCIGTYDVGATALLVPTAMANSTFGGWSNACTNPTGNCSVVMNTSKTATATFTLKPPTVTLVANPTSVAYGGSTVLTWSTTYATGCTAQGDWAGSKAVNGANGGGSETISPLSKSPYIFSISCTGAGGTSPVVSATVTVTAPTVSCAGTLSGLTGIWTATPVPSLPTGLTYTYAWAGTDIPTSPVPSANPYSITYLNVLPTPKIASVILTATGSRTATANCTPAGGLSPLPDLTPLGAAGTNDTGLPNKPVINTGTTNPSDSKYRAGTAITVNVEPKNIGAGFTSPIFSIKLQRKLSTETSYTGGVFAGTVDVAANTVIAKGDTVPKVITTTLPSAVNATYNFRYCIDTDLAVPESNDGNNCSGDLIVPASIGTCTDLNNCPTLTVTKIGTGTGTVTSSETTPKISCGSGAFCIGTYDVGATALLVPTAMANSTFGGWSNACTNPTGNCSVVMNTSKTATATFTLKPPTVTLVANPTSVAYGGSTVLTWSTTYATGCTAQGDWAGSKAVNGANGGGSETISPLSKSPYIFSISCTGAGGTSPVVSATVTVTAPTVSCAGTLSGLTGIWTATPVPSLPTGLTYTYAWAGTDIPTSPVPSANPYSITYLNVLPTPKIASVILTATGSRTATANCTPAGGLSPLPDLTPLGAAGATPGPNAPVVDTATTFTEGNTTYYESGTSIKFKLQPKNIGAGTGTTFVLKMQWKLFGANDNTYGDITNTTSVSGLAKDQIKEDAFITHTSNVSDTSKYEFRYCIDSTSLVTESNEGNNCSGSVSLLFKPRTPTVVLSARLASSNDAYAPTTIDIQDNQKVDLRWVTTNNPTSCSGTSNTTPKQATWNGDSKTASGGTDNQIGPLYSTQSPVRFTITCSKAGVPDISSFVDVVIVSPITVDLRATANPVPYATGPELKWTTTGNPSACTASGGWSGSKSKNAGPNVETVSSITIPTTYTITCTKSKAVDAVSTVTVGVQLAQPTISNISTKTCTSVNDNGKIDVTMTTVTGATSYKLYRNTSDTSPYPTLVGTYAGTSPSFTITDSGLTGGTTYFYQVEALNATGASSGFSARPKSAVASDCRLPTCTLTATPSTITRDIGDSSKLEWATTGAVTVTSPGSSAATAIPGFPTVAPGNYNGSVNLTPTANTTYGITATNLSGSSSCQATVTVNIRPLLTTCWAKTSTQSGGVAHDQNILIDLKTNEDVTWTASGTYSGGLLGGVPPYTYVWAGDTPLAGQTGSAPKFDYSAMGWKSGQVTVTDSVGTVKGPTDCTNRVSVTDSRCDFAFIPNPSTIKMTFIGNSAVSQKTNLSVFPADCSQTITISPTTMTIGGVPVTLNFFTGGTATPDTVIEPSTYVRGLDMNVRATALIRDGRYSIPLIGTGNVVDPATGSLTVRNVTITLDVASSSPKFQEF